MPGSHGRSYAAVAAGGSGNYGNSGNYIVGTKKYADAKADEWWNGGGGSRAHTGWTSGGSGSAPWHKQKGSKTKPDRTSYTVCRCGRWTWDGLGGYCQGCGKSVVVPPPIKAGPPHRDSPGVVGGEQTFDVPIVAAGGPLLGGAYYPGTHDMHVDSGGDGGCEGGQRPLLQAPQAQSVDESIAACNAYLDVFGRAYGVDLWSLVQTQLEIIQKKFQPEVQVPKTDKVVFAELQAAKLAEEKCRAKFDRTEKALGNLRSQLLEAEARHLEKRMELEEAQAFVAEKFEQVAKCQKSNPRVPVEEVRSGATTPDVGLINSDKLGAMDTSTLERLLAGHQAKLVATASILAARAAAAVEVLPDAEVPSRLTENLPKDEGRRSRSPVVRTRSERPSRAREGRSKCAARRKDDDDDDDEDSDDKSVEGTQPPVSQEAAAVRVKAASAAMRGGILPSG
jgi:hypothetical protein